MIFVLLIGFMALYALIAAVMFQSTIASVLAGAMIGVILGGLARYWMPSRRFLRFLPWALALLALAVAISRGFGVQISDFCTAVGSMFVLGYLYLRCAEQANIRSVRKYEQRMRQESFRRKWLEGETLRFLQSVKPGQTLVTATSPEDGRLLTGILMTMQLQGWGVAIFKASPQYLPNLIFWYVAMTAPESQEELQASLDELHSQLASPDE